MITKMIRMEGRNSDRFPVILNPTTIDMIVLPAQLLLSRVLDVGLTDSEVHATWDGDSLNASTRLKVFHTNSRNTTFIHSCSHKLRADLESILTVGSFVMMSSGPVDADDQVVLVNLENVHQMRWKTDSLRVYFDFSLGGRQFLQARDRDEMFDDIGRVEHGYGDNFTVSTPPVEPQKARRTKHHTKLKNKAIPRELATTV